MKRFLICFVFFSIVFNLVSTNLEISDEKIYEAEEIVYKIYRSGSKAPIWMESHRDINPAKIDKLYPGGKIALPSIEDGEYYLEVVVDGEPFGERISFSSREELDGMIMESRGISSEDPTDGGEILETEAIGLILQGPGGTGAPTEHTIIRNRLGIGYDSGDPVAQLDVRSGHVQIWDGGATPGFANLAGELYVENEIEVDGTIYATNWRDAAGNNMLVGGTDIDVAEDVNGQWTIDFTGSTDDGDWQVSGSNMYSIPTGNVGIGTTSPSSKLHVEGRTANIGQSNSVTSPSGSYGANIAIGATNDITGGRGATVLGYGNNSSGDFGTILGVRNDITSSVSGGHVFGLDNTVSATDAFAIGSYVSNSIGNSIQLGWNSSSAPGALVIRDSGNIGINTTSPASDLDVNGTIRADHYRDNAGGNLLNAGTNISVAEQADGSWTINSAGGTGDITGVTAGNDLDGGGSSGTVTLNIEPTLNYVSDMNFDSFISDQARLKVGSGSPLSGRAFSDFGYPGGEGIWLSVGSSYDEGGIFITESGIIVQGDGDNDLMRIYDDDRSSEVYVWESYGGFRPGNDNDVNLGASGYDWDNFYLQGAIYLNGSAGSSGQVLTSNGTGDAYWSTASGGGTYYAGNDLDLSGTTFNIEPTLDYVDKINLNSPGYTDASLNVKNAPGGEALRIQGSSSSMYGGKLAFGDGNYVYLEETTDDELLIRAAGSGIELYTGYSNGDPGDVLYSDGQYAYWDDPPSGGSGGGPCDHEILLYDTYGDGWHGNNSCDVYVDGSLVLNDITLSSGGGPATFTFSASSGSSIEVTFVGGSWPYECYYDVVDGTGALLVNDWYPNTSGTWTGTGNCSSLMRRRDSGDRSEEERTISKMGTMNLEDGIAEVSFDREFSEALNEAIPTVVVTPLADTDIYLESSNSDGFTVRETDGRTSDAMFNWIAMFDKTSIAEEDDAEKPKLGEDYHDLKKEFLENPEKHSHEEWKAKFDEIGGYFMPKDRYEELYIETIQEENSPVNTINQ